MSPSPPNIPSDPMVGALLNEVLARLRDLLVTGVPARIDLRRLPLPPEGLSAIRDLLGEGEIEATMRGVGSCSFRETGTSGVWWVIQRNAGGETVGEFIEVAMVPELLKCAREDVEEAVRLLRGKVGTSPTSG